MAGAGRRRRLGPRPGPRRRRPDVAEPGATARRQHRRGFQVRTEAKPGGRSRQRHHPPGDRELRLDHAGRRARQPARRVRHLRPPVRLQRHPGLRFARRFQHPDVADHRRQPGQRCGVRSRLHRARVSARHGPDRTHRIHPRPGWRRVRAERHVRRHQRGHPQRRQPGRHRAGCGLPGPAGAARRARELGPTAGQRCRRAAVCLGAALARRRPLRRLRLDRCGRCGGGPRRRARKPVLRPRGAGALAFRFVVQQPRQGRSAGHVPERSIDARAEPARPPPAGATAIPAKLRRRHTAPVGAAVRRRRALHRAVHLRRRADLANRRQQLAGCRGARRVHRVGPPQADAGHGIPGQQPPGRKLHRLRRACQKPRHPRLGLARRCLRARRMGAQRDLERHPWAAPGRQQRDRQRVESARRVDLECDPGDHAESPLRPRPTGPQQL